MPLEMSLNVDRTIAIGVMSGTSLDGMDLCYAEFAFDGKWEFNIVAAECISYDEKWTEDLESAHTFSSEKLSDLSRDFGAYTGQQINAFLQKFELAKPDIICSHGHTVFHNPAKKFTLQIGDGHAIAETCGITTVSDFRSFDVSVGGQGAPLVPIGDELLFSEYDACLNLGGFSNISFNKTGERRAFDICPVNIVLNPLAQLLGKPFDDNGLIAKLGSVNQHLLRRLNSLSVYAEAQRPSLAREWLEREFLPNVEKESCSVKDKMRTIVEHAAQQIALVVNSNAENGRVLITGGGCKNGFLIERIQELCSSQIVIPSEELVDYKEALIFAFLGVLKMHNQINVLRSVTGARIDSSSGVISRPLKTSL